MKDLIDDLGKKFLDLILNKAKFVWRGIMQNVWKLVRRIFLLVWLMKAMPNHVTYSAKGSAQLSAYTWLYLFIFLSVFLQAFREHIFLRVDMNRIILRGTVHTFTWSAENVFLIFEVETGKLRCYSAMAEHEPRILSSVTSVLLYVLVSSGYQGCGLSHLPK